VYGSQNKHRLLPYATSTDWFCVKEVDTVYCAVRTESLNKTHVSPTKGGLDGVRCMSTVQIKGKLCPRTGHEGPEGE
jgi:hypothetical protein